MGTPQTERFCSSSSSSPQQFSLSRAPVTGHTVTSIRAGRGAWGPPCPVLPPVPKDIAPGTPGRGNGTKGSTGRHVWLGMQEAAGMLLPGPAQPSLPWTACKGLILSSEAHGVPDSFPHIPPSFYSVPPFRFILSWQRQPCLFYLPLHTSYSQLTLALGTTHSLSRVLPKHLPLHRACIAPHPPPPHLNPVSFQGETNPSSSAGHSSPADGLGPAWCHPQPHSPRFCMHEPPAPFVPYHSTPWCSCWVPVRAVTHKSAFIS